MLGVPSRDRGHLAVEGALAALEVGFVFEFIGGLEPELPAACAAQGVVLGIAVCLTNAVQAEEMGFDEGVQFLLRDAGTMELDLKTLRSEPIRQKVEEAVER